MAERTTNKDQTSDTAHLSALPTSYYLDESDPDILILRREDGTFAAAFSSRGATKEGIVEAAKEDYRILLETQSPDAEEGEGRDT